MLFVDNSSDVTKQLQLCYSPVTSAMQEDRNQAVYKSASNFSLSSMQSYPQVPIGFPKVPIGFP